VLEHARLTDVATVSKKAANASPTKIGLKEGDKVTIETLLYSALIRSANDAAVALAEAVAGSERQFVELMNKKAFDIGAEHTKFVNANGLPGKGQYTTAYDLSMIMRQAIQYPVLKNILNTRVAEVSTQSGKTIFIKNTNKLLWSDEDIWGGKTGYTRKAMHCFVCAGGRENETIIVALLGAPSRDVLWKESRDLMAFGMKVMDH
jgi:serine-type D-Ala-D-Ala carboxypeptidase (penicillin-binding protein 5/6)